MKISFLRGNKKDLGRGRIEKNLLLSSVVYRVRNRVSVLHLTHNFGHMANNKFLRKSTQLKKILCNNFKPCVAKTTRIQVKSQATNWKTLFTKYMRGNIWEERVCFPYTECSDEGIFLQFFQCCLKHFIVSIYGSHNQKKVSLCPLWKNKLLT